MTVTPEMIEDGLAAWDRLRAAMRESKTNEPDYDRSDVVRAIIEVAMSQASPPPQTDAGQLIANCAFEAMQTPPPQDEVALLDWLANNSALELTHGPVGGDLSYCAWQVHSVNGGHNDREWTLVAIGPTPLVALQDARAALTASRMGGDDAR